MNERQKLPVFRVSQRGLLSRLRNDTAGNTLMLVAGALIPLTAMIGAGVDISRSYLVKSRLQQACDAGVLAGRKFMTNGNFTSTAETRSRAFFSNNFPTGSLGTTNITFTPVETDDNQVSGTAGARVPMTVMTVFGNQSIDIAVRCDARLDIGNTDVALVLDVTGSMGDPLGASTRIAALKTAVLNFYDTLGPGDPAQGRIRYAVIPYSTNVNVGYSLPSSAIIGGTGSDTWTYQTRVANMTKPVYTGTPGAPVAGPVQTYSSGTGISQTNCGKYGINQSFSGFSGGSNPVITGGPAPTAQTSTTYSNNSTSGVDWGWSGAPDTGGSTKSCRRRSSAVTTTYTLVGYSFNNWIFKQRQVDVGGFASGSAVSLYTSSANPTGYVPDDGEYDMRSLVSTPGSTVTSGISSVTWDGCIEERKTDDAITSATPVTSLPADALDLDIDLAATDDDSRWKPAWINLIYSRNTLGDASSGTKQSTSGCPAQRARRLMNYTSVTSAPTENSSLSSFQTYINSLTLGGGTMHDIGFMWGARFISGTGIFAADNPSTWNGQPVGRHIIFMTDGIMNAHTDQYVFHGYNELDQRVAPRGTNKATIDATHTRRLRIACEQAKSKNMTVWVIAFAEGVATDYPDLRACATTVNHFKFAADAADLNAEFQNIAASIAKLRLAQ